MPEKALTTITTGELVTISFPPTNTRQPSNCRVDKLLRRGLIWFYRMRQRRIREKWGGDGEGQCMTMNGRA
jgi:hypothetical protein